jgi:hypothetical protein
MQTDATSFTGVQHTTLIFDRRQTKTIELKATG